MQFDINDHRSFFIAADTDSAIFTMDPLLKKILGEDYNTRCTDEEIMAEMKTYLKKYSDKLNKEYLNVFAKNKFNVTDHKFNWKTENIIKTALWTGKRRYAQFIVEKEGVTVEELDFKGLELMKSNMNKIFKSFGENLIKDILFGKPKHEIDANIVEFYKSLKDIEPKKLGKPTGVSYIKKCIASPPRAGQIFSKLNINTKQNSKSAIFYNDLLKFKGLDKQYESIIEGDKISIINLKPNPYRIDVIGLPNAKVPPDIDKFVKEFIDIESIFESLIMNKFRDLYDDIQWELPNLNPNISKFFKY